MQRYNNPVAVYEYFLPYLLKKLTNRVVMLVKVKIVKIVSLSLKV